MKNGLLLLSAIALCSCSTVARQAPRFTKPSTAAIGQANQKATAAVKRAKDKAVAIEKAAPVDLKPLVHDLQQELDAIQIQLQVSEGARAQLETQVGEETDKANNLADSYDKEFKANASLKASRHRYVTYCLYLGGLLAVSLVWIFRRLIFLLIGGLGI